MNFFGLDAVLSAIRNFLKPATIRRVWNFTCLLLTGKSKTITAQPLGEDATDFELATAAAKALDLGDEDVILPPHTPAPFHAPNLPKAFTAAFVAQIQFRNLNSTDCTSKRPKAIMINQNPLQYNSWPMPNGMKCAPPIFSFECVVPA